MVTTSQGGIPPKFVPRPEYIDINSTMISYNDMNILRQAGVFTGWKTTKGYEFRPNEFIRRGDFLSLIYYASGAPAFTVPTTSPYIDVTTKHPNYKEFTWARSKGIETGTKTAKGYELRPLNNMRRDELAILLFRATTVAKNYKAPTTSRFIDIKTNHRFYKEISWADANGIVTGTKSTKGYEFSASATTRRNLIAGSMVKWMKLIDKPTVSIPGTATYKIASSITNKLTGSISFNNLVAKRFSMGTSVQLYRDVNKVGWEKWLTSQFALTETSDKAWLDTYSSRWLPMVNLPYKEAEVNYKAKTGTALTGVGVDAGTRQRESMSILRQIYSKRQVNEIWTNFWLDHFSVPYSETGQQDTFNIDLWMRDRAMSSFPEILNSMLRSLKLYQFLNANDSKKGKINENLARELLELYTIGITTGIEEDIRQLAIFLTGFSHSWDGLNNLAFFDAEHDTSVKTVKVLGKTYQNSNVNYTNVYPILDQLSHDLAWDSRTIKFICTKIASHFVKDAPTSAMINALIRTYKRTGGSIKDMMMTMIYHPDFVKNIGSKWRRPQEMLATHQSNLGPVQNLEPTLKAHPYYGSYQPCVEYLAMLSLAGHYPRNNHSPKGYDNKASTWMNASSILHTVNALHRYGSFSPTTYKTTKTFRTALGYADGDYSNTAKKLVRETTGFTCDTNTVNVITKILSNKSMTWDDRINTAVSRAYSSPYGFIA